MCGANNTGGFHGDKRQSIHSGETGHSESPFGEHKHRRPPKRVRFAYSHSSVTLIDVTSINFLSFLEDVWRESVLTSAARASQILSHPFKPLLMGKY